MTDGNGSLCGGYTYDVKNIDESGIDSTVFNFDESGSTLTTSTSDIAKVGTFTMKLVASYIDATYT